MKRSFAIVRVAFAFAAGALSLACNDAEPTSRDVPAAGNASEAAAEIERGRELAEGGDVDAAALAFQHAVELNDEDAAAHFYLGTTQVLRSYVQGGHGEAEGGAAVSLGRNDALMTAGIESLRRAVELAPGDTDYGYELGRALHVAERHDEAVNALTRVVQLDPEHGAAYKRLGLVHLDHGDLVAAREALATAERLLPDDPGVPYQLGNALVEDDPSAAADAFRRSLAIDPTFPPPYHGLVSVLARLGDADGAAQARDDFERWRRFQEKVERAERRADKREADPEAQVAVGDLHFSKGRWREAADFYGRTLRIDPRHTHAHFRMGHVALELGELEVARNHFEEALFLTPDALEPRIELIRVCARQGEVARRDELLAEVRQGAASLASDGCLLFGDVLLELGESEEARVQYGRIGEEAPEYAEARERLDRLEHGEGRR